MKVDYVDGKDYYTITGINDFNGWKIQHVQYHKRNVRKISLVYANPPNSKFIFAYCPLNILREYKKSLQSQVKEIKVK